MNIYSHRNHIVILAAIYAVCSGTADARPIQHDSEHYVLLHQYEEQWTAEDEEIDKELSEIRSRNGGKKPNIVYILIDDMGFGEFGIPALNKIRGVPTPNIDSLAQQGATFTRMYAENFCTPTRAAFMTGRYAVRTGMESTKVVPPEGGGLNDAEVTIAELLSDAGYATHHIGKWHLGDIKEAYPVNQGFDYASFPMHNQFSYSFQTRDAELDGKTVGFMPESVDPDYGLDKTARLYDWVLQVEGRKGGPVREWGVEAGERPSIDLYKRVNQRFQEQALSSLRVLAGGDEPFFLNYWPQIPVAVLRSTDDPNLTANGGRWANAMGLVDAYVGEILDEIDRLGIADNTIVFLMGDNGVMYQDIGTSGYSEWIFRGRKGSSLEGGHRVGAFARWPGVIEPGSLVGDMVFVGDLYTTFARIAGNTDDIPRDRIVDGIDQTALILKGDTHGRRDYIHLYELNVLKATVKQQFKMHWPGPGGNPLTAGIYNLYWDPREENKLTSGAATWGAEMFTRMRVQHVQMKQKFPDWKKAQGMPYEDVANMRPETREMVETWLRIYGTAKDVVLGVGMHAN